MKWRLFIGCWLIVAHAIPAAEPDQALARGINYLLTQQLPNGSFSEQPPPQLRHTTAMTGLASLALLAVGHRPSDVTPAGKALRQALTFVLADKNTNGYYGASDNSNMYGHGIVTLLLAESIGMGTDAQQDASIRNRCQRGIELIVRSQKVPKAENFQGGWRYSPTSTDSDLSVTVWQVMALRAAKNAGLNVPKETMDTARAYILRSYAPTTAFAYMPGRSAGYATAAAGVLALQVCGDTDAPELQKSVVWLQALKTKDPTTAHFYYGTYYYAQGPAADPRLAAILVAQQNPNGSWQGRGAEASPVYCTSLAILTLSVHHHFMPIYQR